MKFTLTLLILFVLKLASAQNNSSLSSPTEIEKVAAFAQPLKGDTVPYATLYFYRSYIRPMNAPIKKVPIYINDSLVHSLKANMLFGIKMFNEGRVIIAIDSKGETATTIKVKTGKEYFFKCEIVKGLWFGKPYIEAVSPATGRAETGLFKGD